MGQDSLLQAKPDKLTNKKRLVPHDLIDKKKSYGQKINKYNIIDQVATDTHS